MPTRVPTFVEQVIRRGQADARNDLDVYSRSETLAAIPPVDFAPVEADIAAISGSVYALDTSFDSLNAEFVAMSGALNTDVYNFDVALTQKIATDCLQSEGISGSSTTVNGYLDVTINGVSYRLATVAP